MFKRVIKIELFENDALIFSTSDLRIDFEYETSFSVLLDMCRIDIYNLAPDTILSLTKNIDTRLSVKMYAGYADEDGGNNLVFHGRIQNMADRVARPDHITTLFCLPTIAEKLTKHVVKDINSEETLEQVLNAVADGVRVKMSASIDSGLKGLTIPFRTVRGETREVIDDLCFEFGVVPIVDGDNSIIITPERYDSVDEVINRNDKGLIHKIEVNKTKGTPQLGLMTINFPYVLDFKIRPNHVIDVTEYKTTGTANGIANFQDNKPLYYQPSYREYAVKDRYMTFEVVHKGSNFEDVWQTDIGAKHTNTSNTQGGGEG